MTDLQNHSQRTAATRAGFSERTARRFDADPTPRSKRKIVHGRTVADPLEVDWENDLLPLLEKDSTLQAVVSQTAQVWRGRPGPLYGARSPLAQGVE